MRILKRNEGIKKGSSEHSRLEGWFRSNSFSTILTIAKILATVILAFTSAYSDNTGIYYASTFAFCYLFLDIVTWLTKHAVRRLNTLPTVLRIPLAFLVILILGIIIIFGLAISFGIQDLSKGVYAILIIFMLILLLTGIQRAFKEE